MALELEVTVLVVAGDELEGEPADHVADFVLGAVVVLGAGGGEGGGEGGCRPKGWWRWIRGNGRRFLCGRVGSI